MLAASDLTGEDEAAFVDFEEEPVPLDVFVRDRKYLANPALGEIQYEAVRHIERVYLPDTYKILAHSDDKAVADYWSRPASMVNLVTLQWGKGSGKDHICRISALRVCYLLLCLRSPQSYFEMPEQDSIHVLNVASSSKQASRAFFSPMRRAVLRPGNWFQTMGVDVVEAPRAGRVRNRQTTDKSTQALMDTIRFPKNIEAVSGHSDADSQEGLNLILGIADEIDAFRSRAELEKVAGNRLRESSSSAEALLDMLRTSASTRFPVTYKNVRISYPRYKGSTIQKLTAEGKADIAENGEKSRHYVSGPKATWEVNPRLEGLGKAAFAEDYKKDPVLAAAKYECNPAYAVNPYFSNEQALRDCTRDGPEPLLVDYVRDRAAWKPSYAFHDKLFPVQGARYVMHADLAVNGCRAGVALAHVKSWDEVNVMGDAEDGGPVHLTEFRPVVKVDFVIGYESSVSAVPPREIQIRWVSDLCLELRRRGFPVVLFTADQWNSVDLKQRLETYGIETDRFSLDKDEVGWRTLRDLAYSGRLDLPRNELLITELLGLSRLPNGKIDHPADGSKDLADAVGGAVSGAIAVGGQEDADGNRAWPGGGHHFGGNANMSLAPIGMPPLGLLATEDPLPQEIRDREKRGVLLPGGGWIDDFGEVTPRMT